MNRYLMTNGAEHSEDLGPELFFQLASPDRKRILVELQKEDLHLNEIAKRLGMTPTEALRQLQRMTEARLLEKMPNGSHRLTPYAKIVLDVSAPLDFLSQHREFFMSHDTSLIPIEYRARLAELSGTRIIPDTIGSMNAVAAMLKNAKSQIDCTIEVGSQVHLEIMRQRVTDGLKVRWLMQESFLPKARDFLGSVKKFPEMRKTDRLRVHIYMNEKEAAVSLRTISGPFDYAIFHGGDHQFLKWAGDMYAHEWERSKPWYP